MTDELIIQGPSDENTVPDDTCVWLVPDHENPEWYGIHLFSGQFVHSYNERGECRVFRVRDSDYD